jgi:hypothetical protein
MRVRASCAMFSLDFWYASYVLHGSYECRMFRVADPHLEVAALVRAHLRGRVRSLCVRWFAEFEGGWFTGSYIVENRFTGEHRRFVFEVVREYPVGGKAARMALRCCPKFRRFLLALGDRRSGG